MAQLEKDLELHGRYRLYSKKLIRIFVFPFRHTIKTVLSDPDSHRVELENYYRYESGTRRHLV